MAITKIIKDLLASDSGWSTSSESGLRMPKGGAFSGTAEPGMIRNDDTQDSAGSESTMQHYNGIDWKNFVNKANPLNVEYLVVAGGGGGGARYGGGGGAGGYLTNYGGTPLSLIESTNYIVTVGAGGAGGTGGSNGGPGSSGSNSVFNNITSNGGGGGSGADIGPSRDGGSGGGGSLGDASGGIGSSGPPIQGYNGGDYAGGTDYKAGGGGGASEVGESGSTTRRGDGGDGLQNAITVASGTGPYYAGGGGGGSHNPQPSSGGGTGGSGGGGNAGTMGSKDLGDPGTDYKGGGGGGGSTNTGGSSASNGGFGGSGIVILRCTKATATLGSGITVNSTAGPGSVNGVLITGTSDYYYSATLGSGTITFS